MSKAGATRDTWHPHTRQDREDVLFELQQVLSSPQFSNSKRYPALLQYIVESTLADKSELLKERTLGVEVFDRPASYDTNADTVVRYTAGEVRKRLSLYYHALDRKPRIQISLPAGSYVPEFLLHDDAEEEPGHTAVVVSKADAEHTSLAVDTKNVPGLAALSYIAGAGEDGVASLSTHHKTPFVRWRLLALIAAVAVAAVAGLSWRYRAVHAWTPLDAFWAPVIHDQRTVLFCTGGVVFAQNNFSGVTTAGKDIDYPFVSMQIASAIARLSGLVERNGTTAQLQAAASTPLTELRDRPVILLGGYNNQWTLRLLESLPLHFSPEANASIVDTQQPQVRWARDRSLPYSSADDYALIARFRDTTTDSWVVVLAGLGRNGTEAAAQVATSPHYMQQLQEKIGSDFGSRNIEAVLQVSVIDGKTGAPTILAARAW